MLAHPKYKVFELFLLWVRNISGTYFFSLLVIFGEEQLWYVDYFLSYSFILREGTVPRFPQGTDTGATVKNHPA